MVICQKKFSITFCLVIQLLIFSFLPKGGSASLMGKGTGLFSRNRPNGVRPWDAPRHNHPQYYYEVAQEEEEEAEENRRRQETEALEHEDGSKPCVGLCYHNKVQALKNKEEGNEGNENETQEEEIVFEELSTHRPCVGICQYYRSMGVEDPYEAARAKLAEM